MLDAEFEWLQSVRCVLQRLSLSFASTAAFAQRDDAVQCVPSIVRKPAQQQPQQQLQPQCSASLESLVRAGSGCLLQLVEEAEAAAGSAASRLHWLSLLQLLLFSNWHCCLHFLHRPLFPHSLSLSSASCSPLQPDSSSSREKRRQLKSAQLQQLEREADGEEGGGGSRQWRLQETLQSLLYGELSSPVATGASSCLPLPCYLYFALLSSCGLQAQQAETLSLLSPLHRRQCEAMAAVYAEVTAAFAAAASGQRPQLQPQQTDSLSAQPVASTAPGFTFIVSMSSALSSQPAFSPSLLPLPCCLLALLSVSAAQPAWIDLLAALHRLQHGAEFGHDCAPVSLSVYAADVVEHGLTADLCLSLLRVRHSLTPLLTRAPPSLPPSAPSFCRSWLRWLDLALSACRLLAEDGQAEAAAGLRAACWQQRLQDDDVLGSEAVSEAVLLWQRMEDESGEAALEPSASPSAPLLPSPDSVSASLNAAFLSRCVPCPLLAAAGLQQSLTSALNQLVSSAESWRQTGGSEGRGAGRAEVVLASIRSPVQLVVAVVQRAVAAGQADGMAELLRLLQPASASAQPHLCSFRLQGRSSPVLCDALNALLFPAHSPQPGGGRPAPASVRAPVLQLLLASAYIPRFHPSQSQLLVRFLSALFPQPPAAPAASGPDLCWCTVQRLRGCGFPVPPSELASALLIPALARYSDTPRSEALLAVLHSVLSLYRVRDSQPAEGGAGAAAARASLSAQPPLTVDSFPAFFHFPFGSLCVALCSLLQRRSALSQAQLDLVLGLVALSVELVNAAADCLLCCPAASLPPAVLPAASRAYSELHGLHLTLSRAHWSLQLRFYPLLNHALHALFVFHTPSGLSANLPVPLPAALLPALNRSLAAAYDPQLSAPWFALTACPPQLATGDPSPPSFLLLVDALLLFASASDACSDWLSAALLPLLTTQRDARTAAELPQPLLFLRSAVVCLSRQLSTAGTAEAQRLLSRTTASLAPAFLPASLPARSRPLLCSFLRLQLLLYVAHLSLQPKAKGRHEAAASRAKTSREPQLSRVVSQLAAALSCLRPAAFAKQGDRHAAGGSRGSGGDDEDVDDELRVLALLASCLSLLCRQSDSLRSVAASSPRSPLYPLQLLCAQLYCELFERQPARLQPASSPHGHTRPSSCLLLEAWPASLDSFPLLALLPEGAMAACLLCPDCWLRDADVLPPAYRARLKQRLPDGG